MNAIMQNFDKIFNASLIYATFRSATPIIFAALCAAITQQANILNIGTEGIMLVGAFTAVAVSYFTGSWLLGIHGSDDRGCCDCDDHGGRSHPLQL